MRYQFVLQIQAETAQEFNERLFLRTYWSNLHSPSEVHGHDFGSGEFNIFILTGQQRVGDVLSGHLHLPSLCPVPPKCSA
jgi:hypothetical protein